MTNKQSVTLFVNILFTTQTATGGQDIVLLTGAPPSDMVRIDWYIETRAGTALIEMHWPNGNQK